MSLRLIVRAFKSGVRLWEYSQTIADADLTRAIARLGEQHAARMVAGDIGMIELEFPDDPDPEQRFFRIGVETAGMVAPIDLLLLKKQKGKQNGRAN